MVNCHSPFHHFSDTTFLGTHSLSNIRPDVSLLPSHLQSWRCSNDKSHFDSNKFHWVICKIIVIWNVFWIGITPRSNRVNHTIRWHYILICINKFRHFCAYSETFVCQSICLLGSKAVLELVIRLCFMTQLYQKIKWAVSINIWSGLWKAQKLQISWGPVLLHKQFRNYVIRNQTNPNIPNLEIWRSDSYVENEDVVGAAPTGDAPTTSEWSTILSAAYIIGLMVLLHFDITKGVINGDTVEPLYNTVHYRRY